MTERLSNRERLLKEHCNTWYHLRIGIIATLVDVFNGITVGFGSSTNRKIMLKELPFPTVDSDVSFVSTTASLCTLLGPILFTFTLNCLGRKPTLMMLLIPVIVQYVIIFFTTDIVQLTIGISIGNIPNLITPSVLGVYLTEMEAPHLRGSLNAFSHCVFMLGTLIGLVVNWTCTLKQSSLAFLVGSGVYMWVASTLPETPYYLIRNNRRKDATLVLKQLYGQELGELEVLRLEEHVQSGNTGAFKDIFLVRKHRKTIGLLFILFVTKYFSGYMILVWFSPILLSNGTYKYLSPFSCEVIILVSAFVFALFVSILYRYVPRRPLGITSVLIMVAAFSVLIVYFSVGSHVPDVVPFVPLLFVKLSGLLGVVSLPFMYFREFTPVQYVAYYSLIIDFSVPILNTTCMVIFNFFWLNYGFEWCFGFFVVSVGVGGLLFYFFIPETHQRLIENVQEDL